MDLKTNIYSSEFLRDFIEFSDLLNLKVKTTKDKGVVKYSFKYKNRTLFIIKIKDNFISVSVVLWLLDLYYSDINTLSRNVINAIEDTKGNTLVYDMFGKHCISYSFRFENPCLQVIGDLKYLLQKEILQIEKLTA